MTDFNDLHYTVPDGLTLYARDYPGPSADAPVALLMHGLTRNSRDFEDLAPQLAASHRVLVPDQRGRGRSEWDSNPARYLPATYIGDMFVLLASQGVDRVAAVGTSMGGLMAMGMAAVNAGVFSHVVLNDIGPVIAQEGLDRIKAYVGSGSEFPDWDSAAAYMRQVNGSAFPHYGDADWLRFARRTCAERDGRVVLDHDQAISAPMKEDTANAAPSNLWPLFDALAGVPMMLVRGATTDLLDLPTTEEMRRRRPDLRYLEVPDVGHAPMLDEAGVAEAIIAFINS